MATYAGIFADIYPKLTEKMIQHPVDIACRGHKIAYEMTNVSLEFDVSKGISVYSNTSGKTLPIAFVLAEFLWFMSGSNRLEWISNFNKTLLKYSDDGVTLHGAYGYRITHCLRVIITKLIDDKYSRQACIPIFDHDDIYTDTKDLPCNTFLQFMIRDNQLNLIVTSRSSDFITGLSIDSIQWQLLLTYVCNHLRVVYLNLKYGTVQYNIASLHIYETDKDNYIKWEHDSHAKITLNTSKHSYMRLIFNFDEHYRKNRFPTTLTDLTSIYEFDSINLKKILLLDDMFKNRKFRVVR